MQPDAQDLMETVGLLRQVTADIVTSADLEQAMLRLADLAVELAPGPAWCGDPGAQDVRVDSKRFSSPLARTVAPLIPPAPRRHRRQGFG